MKTTEKEKLLSQPEYAFLKTEERLKNNIILLGLAGSYSYGTNIPTSDIDIRGLSRNTKEDLLGLNQQTNTGLYTGLYASPCHPVAAQLQPQHGRDVRTPRKRLSPANA